MKRFQVGPARLGNGWEAHIYATDGDSDYPIHGWFRRPGGHKAICVWAADGSYCRSDLDRNGRDLLPNAVPVVSDAAMNAYYDARGWSGVDHPRTAVDRDIAAGIAAAFAVMLAEQCE